MRSVTNVSSLGVLTADSINDTPSPAVVHTAVSLGGSGRDRHMGHRTHVYCEYCEAAHEKRTKIDNFLFVTVCEP
jgi:hypothetical protein